MSLLGWLAACLAPDLDGDGFRADDCDDLRPEVHPGAPEACDGVDTDCDGRLPPEETDDDGDGFVECDAGSARWLGAAPPRGGGDCDDAAPAVFPGAAEACDGVDDDCDGALSDAERDADGDGAPACDAGDGRRPDCDDGDATVGPGAAERCDGLDDDCDGALAPFEEDADGDGFAGCTPEAAWSGALPPGDCDDDDAAVFPGAVERCDGKDGDCDGAWPADEADPDRDGVLACVPVVEGVRGGDCDDGRPEVLPGAPELCDGLDDDCDGALWEAEADLDGDGWVACRIVGGWAGSPIRGDDDCLDTAASVHPDGGERLDGVDSDCDGELGPLERDDDGDGYVEAEVGPDWPDPTVRGGDCDDRDPTVSPGAQEACNGVDDTCDGVIGVDELDLDGDGFVACAFAPGGWKGATAPAGGGGDCDDAAPEVHPGAPEACDAEDTDCDRLDDGDDDDVDPATFRTFWRDDDADDWGEDGSALTACRLPPGYAPQPHDCDDGDRAVHPFAREDCNGVDDDCDTLVDDEDDDVDPDLQRTWTRDADRDGFGDADGVPVLACDAPAGSWSSETTDCDDRDARVFPGARELCDGLDTDCDGHGDVPGASGGDVLGCDRCDTGRPLRPNQFAFETWNPCVLDPAAVAECYDGVVRVDTHTQGERLARVMWRTDTTAWRPELYLHLPPAKGNFNAHFQEWVAQAGYRTIMLPYATDIVVNDVCTDDACRYAFAEEVFWGNDTSPYVEVGPPDGVAAITTTLLRHLAATEPEVGWGDFLRGDEVDWDRVLIGGWSKALWFTAYAATQVPVNGVVAISSQGLPVPYPSLAPPCRSFGLYHQDELDRPLDEWLPFYRSLGMEGDPFPLEGAAYPWAGSPQIFTTRSWDYERDDCTPHKATQYDGCMDEGVLRREVLDLFCHFGDQDPTCR